jgi:PKD domain
MALRRELLPLLLAAAFLLVGPATALAAPTWLGNEGQDAAVTPQEDADVAADADGNAVAVWVANDEVRAAFRPRGGDWQPEGDLEPDFFVVDFVPPHVVARPDGTFVAVWNGDRNNDGDDVLRSATRSTGGEWTTEDVRDPPFADDNLLEVGGDGSVTVVSQNDGSSVSNTKIPGQAGWSAEETVPGGITQTLAVAPDGSSLAATESDCNPDPEAFTACVIASRRARQGAWSAVQTVALAEEDAITGMAAAANSDSSFSIVWGETRQIDGVTPPALVRSNDRGAGDNGTWSTDPLTVATLPVDLPTCAQGNCFDLAVGPGDRQLALWFQNGESGNLVRAALRNGPVVGWDPAQEAGPADSVNGARPFGAITATGVPVAAWGSATSAGSAHGSHFEGGEWDPVVLNSTPPRGGFPNSTQLGGLAADGEGDAVTAWRDTFGVATAGFDAVGPTFTEFSLPTGGLTFSAAATDNWSGPPAISWLFGDGASASGGTVSHAYGGPGTYTATATATDVVGNATSQSGPVTVTQTQPPDPCGTADTDKDGINNGCDDSNGAQRPRPFRTVNATVVSGDVFVKLPAGSARASQRKPPKGFVRLQGAETIPVGAQLDTSRGRVKVRSAATTGRKLQTGQFFRGRFKIRQVRIKRRSKRLITDMQLTGSSFRKTCGASRAAISQRKRSKKRVRRLFGSAKGRFRTSGRHAAATVRGTRWSIQDRCDGTLVKVQQGRVQVRDKVKRRNVIVRTGRTYLARAR